MPPNQIVYIPRSLGDPGRAYVGVTHDLRRLADHNAGRCPHTTRYGPWTLHFTIELPDDQTSGRLRALSEVRLFGGLNVDPSWEGVGSKKAASGVQSAA